MEVAAEEEGTVVAADLFAEYQSFVETAGVVVAFGPGEPQSSQVSASLSAGVSAAVDEGAGTAFPYGLGAAVFPPILFAVVEAAGVEL